MPRTSDDRAPVPTLEAALRALRDGQSASGTPLPVLTLDQTHDLARRYGCAMREVEWQALSAGLAPLRYERNLGTVGLAGQARLLRATVAVVGCGGLGGWVIEGLARMGAGHLIIVDADVFAESNLNRQLGCLESTLGQSKARCLADRVHAVNGAIEVTAHVTRLREDNAAMLLDGAEVVVDALDSIADRLVLARTLAALGLPLIHGAVGGFAGQVMTIMPGDPGLEALYSGATVPLRGVETELGNPAATPMMIASWQVQEVVKLLVGEGELIRNRLLVLDAEYGDVTEIRLS